MLRRVTRQSLIKRRLFGFVLKCSNPLSASGSRPILYVRFCVDFPVWSSFPYLCMALISGVADIEGLSHSFFMTNSGIVGID